MRVGPVGWAFRTEEETLKAARISAACTHNHPEGIKGAQATALCIFLARDGKSKEDIKNTVEAKFDYDLNFTCDGIRDTYQWDATCQGTVPQAIRAFLDGTDFEDCIRTAISLGGDSDTLACITGSIAEAFYGIPPALHAQTMHYLPTHFQQIVTEFEGKFGPEIR
jgi:ADP-ribosylglycohydrolase